MELSGNVVTSTYITVPGTHGDNGESTGLWWQAGSPFARFMHRHGVEPFNDERPFTWSTDLNGHRFWRRWLGMRDSHRDWIAAGYALCYYLWPLHEQDQYVQIENRNVIAHSHGGQVVFYACAYGGLRINRLITVGTPIRRDMRAVIERARPNIGQWLHVRGTTDHVALWGSIGDGSLVKARTFDGREDWTDVVPDIRHSRVLTEEEVFYATWVMRGWIEFLKRGW